MARTAHARRDGDLQPHEQVLVRGRDEREEVDGALGRGHEGARDDDGGGGGGERDAADAVDQLAEADLRRDFEAPAVVGGDALLVLLEEEQVPLRVAFEEGGVVVDVRDGRGPGDGEVPGGFGEGGGRAGDAGGEVHDGDGFHDVGDGDVGAGDGEVDGGGGGSVGGEFGEVRGGEGVDDDLGLWGGG